MKSAKVEAPNFEGQLNPKVFLDRLADMDHFFAWYEMSEGRKFRFAKMKLVGQAKLYWTNVERQIERAGEEPITFWDEKKDRLREKYVPLSYCQQLLDKRQSLPQGSMPVIEYIPKFEELMFRCNVTEGAAVTLSRFRTGLLPEIQRELITHDVDSLERAYQIVQEVERYINLKATSTTKQMDLYAKGAQVSTSTSESNLTPKVFSGANNKGKGVAKNANGGETHQCYRCKRLWSLRCTMSDKRSI